MRRALRERCSATLGAHVVASLNIISYVPHVHISGLASKQPTGDEWGASSTEDLGDPGMIFSSASEIRHVSSQRWCTMPCNRGLSSQSMVVQDIRKHDSRSRRTLAVHGHGDTPYISPCRTSHLKGPLCPAMPTSKPKEENVRLLKAGGSCAAELARVGSLQWD